MAVVTKTSGGANGASGGSGAGVHSEKNVRQVPDNHPIPKDATHPREDAANVPTGRHWPAAKESTLVSMLKEHKEKLKHKNPPGGFDPTPIPDAPPGYTVRFIFHRAANLPTADISTGAADPFLKATLTTALPKRHKEDPDLVFRTRTIRKTLEPEWEEEWVVANVPSSGFRLKCRLYDEDWPDPDDRLGNATILVSGVSEDWEGIPPPGGEFKVKKRVGSKRAYILKACTTAIGASKSMTPRLWVSAVVLGKSDPPHGQIYTVGPSFYFKHFSPMIGRMTGVKVNRDEADDSNNRGTNGTLDPSEERKMQKYDFQANEIQLAGPVPPRLYHRYVEFRPLIGILFRKSGLRGRILSSVLHHQHERIYNFDKGTEWGMVKSCSEEASLQFLKMAHFDEGARTFTYVITLDGLLRFTETGKEFGIDWLSKHTMHSDAAVHVACSGEFLIRRLERPTTRDDPKPSQPTHLGDPVEGGPPKSAPPPKPQYYQLVIDNDSGTYRPDKTVLPDLHAYLQRNFPGLGIVTLACDDPEDQRIKEAQRRAHRSEGHALVNMVLNRSPSASSFSSDDLSDLEDVERAGEAGRRSKKERAWELLEQPWRLKELAAQATGRGDAKKEDGPSNNGASAS
ncbi:hypothetical protein DL769_003595 [Monosporascus sp. CRB-8-3]|nr:hypothetical protein DL769_003595 [Monosporascus sp. CRB-8-3]